MLKAMTAGIATSRPTAVATSASEMPDITAAGAARLVARQIGERLDDAEHGAEQADERRVVAERAEHAEVAFQLDAQARLGAGHRLGDGVGAALEVGDAGGGHHGGGRALSRERLRARRRGRHGQQRSTARAPSASMSPPARRKIARSTITATDRIDSAMSTQSTQSEPSSVKPRIRCVRCMRSPRSHRPITISDAATTRGVAPAGE